jgi:hypothetical protein
MNYCISLSDSLARVLFAAGFSASPNSDTDTRFQVVGLRLSYNSLLDALTHESAIAYRIEPWDERANHVKLPISIFVWAVMLTQKIFAYHGILTSN